MRFKLLNKHDKAKVKFDIPELKGKSRFKHWKRNLLLGFIGFLILSVLVVIGTIKLFAWTDINQVIFQSPIIIQQPVLIEKRKIAILNPLSKAGKILVTQTHAKSLFDIPDWEIIPDNVDKEKWTYLMEQPSAHMLVYIWSKESDYGRDTVQGSLDQYCRTKGQYNEFGMGGMKDMTCYDTFEDNVQAVIGALNGYGKISDEMKLCHYNIGINETDCSYLSDWNK